MNDETKRIIGDAVEHTVEAADTTVKKPVVQSLARFGFLTKGFLFIVIGVLALLVILGIRGGRITDPRGALATIASGWFGTALMMVFAAGAMAHGSWNILRGIADVDGLGRGIKAIVVRIVSIGLGLFYLGLAISSIEILLAVRVWPDNSRAEETLVAYALVVPILGAIFVAIIGFGLIIASLNECYSGVSGKYFENYRSWKIAGTQRAAIFALGFISFTARSLLLFVLGYFFIWAAIFGPPGEGIGLDVSLLSILQSRFGTEVGLFTAVGLICHGVLAFYEARFRRVC